MKALPLRGKPRHWIAAGSAALLATSGLVLTTVITASPANAAVVQVAPYVDMSNNQEPMLNAAASQAGLHNYTAAFVIGSGCTPIWGDTLPVTNDPTMDQEIASARSAGATPIVSFGGAGGSELALTCTTASSLQAAYQSVISHLGVNHIDFDIEGATLDYTSNNNVRFQAIKGLESANPGLVVSVTLPVLPTGLASDGVAFLNLAKQDGTRIDLINVMAMDYGSSFTGDMGQEAIQAAQSTLNQARADWPGDTYANIGVGRLAYWSVDRDQPCSGSASGLPSCSEISQNKLDFTKIFLGGGGNGGGPSPSPSVSHSPSPSPSPTGGTGGGSCYPAWNANTSYVPNDNVSYNGVNYTATYWSTGVTPGSAIAWNIWKSDGPC